MEDEIALDSEERLANSKEHYKVLYQSNCELIENSLLLSPDVGSEDLQNLRDRFGYSSFRPLQWAIINAVMNEKKDVCAALAPGYGRSLCYQYPAVCRDGTVLVISPLIYKMEEEVRSMTISGVSTLFLESCWYNCVKSSVEESLKGNYSIVYLNSDYFPSYEISPLKLLDIKLIVVDEAHCVSEWGHDYRAVYTQVEKIRNMFPNAPLLALTSSPSPPVRGDIISHFKMSDPLIVCSNFDRPNLKFEVQLSTETCIETLLKVLHTNPEDWKNIFEESTIIYVESRSLASAVQKKLEENNIPALEYHSAIVQVKRNYALEQFLNDETKVLVTTVSYGLSIHKPDIRNIIHMCCPKDIESYYQEIGVGGRDGLPTRCILFCKLICNEIPLYIQDVMAQTRKEINRRRTLLIKLMSIFLTTNSCRYQFLKRFNGEIFSAPKPTSDCCDNCKYEILRNNRYQYSDLGLDVYGKYDVGNDFVEYLRVLHKKTPKKCSIDTVAKQLAAEATNDAIPLHTSIRWWQGIGHLLTTKDYIENCFLQKYETSSGITPRGKALLYIYLSDKPPADEIMETPNYLMYKELLYKKTTVIATLTSKTECFMQRLLQRRLQLAKLCGCASFTIASNDVIKTISIAKPRSFTTLQKLNLHGFNRRRLECFGREFVRLIVENLGDSWFIFCSMIKSGVEFHEARKKRITVQSAYEFVATGIRNGFVFEWSQLGITDEMTRQVSIVITKHENMFLSSTPDWNSSEDLKRFASLDIETGKILVIWTYFHQFYQIKLEFPKDGSMISVAEALFKNPLPITIPNGDWIFLSLLGTSSADINRIATIKNIPARKIWDSVATAIMKGHQIKLSTFGITTPEFVEETATKLLSKKEFRTDPNFTHAGELFRRVGLASSSAKTVYGHALLVWAYAHVRIHLYSLNVNFYDFDPPSDKLKLLLLEECVSNSSSKKRVSESYDQETTSNKRRRSRAEKIRRSYQEAETVGDETTEQASAQQLKDADESAPKTRENAANDGQSIWKRRRSYVDKQSEESENSESDGDD